MKEKIVRLFDLTFWKFILVGIVNTVFGTAVMFGCYNLLHLNYWLSSAANYIFGSVLSYFLNKNFTFQNKSKDYKVILKFIINLTICYLVAYGVAKPVIRVALSQMTKKIQENVAMLVGMCLFVGLNYLGQRFWTFKAENVEEK